MGRNLSATRFASATRIKGPARRPITTRLPIAPGTTGLYGPGIGMDGLGNSIVNSDGGDTLVSQRFRAAESSALNSFLWYCQTSVGYGAGNFGIARVTLRTDDGTSNHFPTSTVLATATDVNPPVQGAAQTITFPTPYACVAGTLYHLQYNNVASSPGSNYWSCNQTYRDTVDPGGRSQPLFPDTDWMHLLFNNSAWSNRGGQYTPIIDLTYANGVHQGMGYMEISHGAGVSSSGKINGTNNMVRERFTVTGGDRTISSVYLRLIKIAGGTDALSILLEDDNGTAIETVTIAASAISNGVAPSTGYGGEAVWVSAAFTSLHTFVNGQTYRLRLSTAAGTTYYSFPIRKGGPSYGYNAATYFADGVSQYTDDGSTWASLGDNANENDIQFYFI